MTEKKVLEKRYWTWAVLWDEQYSITPSWRKILMVLCKCDCWNEKYVQRQHLLNWATKNCGCLKKERIAKIGREHTKHGMEGTIPYRKYMGAVARCNNPNNPSYYRYWGRWIKVMRKNFIEFRNDMWPSYYDHLKTYWDKDTTLDRIDVNWNYCKENCRWATNLEQSNNKTDNHSVFYRWQRYPTISELARITWKKCWLVRDRIRNWWAVEEAIDLPLWAKRNIKKKWKRKTV